MFAPGVFVAKLPDTQPSVLSPVAVRHSCSVVVASHLSRRCIGQSRRSAVKRLDPVVGLIPRRRGMLSMSGRCLVPGGSARVFGSMSRSPVVSCSGGVQLSRSGPMAEPSHRLQPSNVIGLPRHVPRVSQRVWRAPRRCRMVGARCAVPWRGLWWARVGWIAGPACIPYERHGTVLQLALGRRSQWLGHRAAITGWCGVSCRVANKGAIPKRAMRLVERAIRQCRRCGGGRVKGYPVNRGGQMVRGAVPPSARHISKNVTDALFDLSISLAVSRLQSDETL